MKKINLLLTLLVIFGGIAKAQTPYNPFTQNIHFVVEPTIAGFPCGSVQTVSFTQGLTTQDSANDWQNNPLRDTIRIAGFTFNGTASAVVSGSYAANFNWAYSTTDPNVLIGTQNQPLSGTGMNPLFPNPLSSGIINVSLLVPANSPVSTVLSVDVTLEIPTYMQAFNSVPDDAESTQTQTFCDCYVLTNAGVIAADQSFCQSGDPAPFTTVNPVSGGSGGVILYQWQELVGATWTDISGATSENYDAPPTTVSTEYRRNSKRSLCGDWLNSNSLTITIKPNPIADAGLDKNLDCITLFSTLGTSAILGNSYIWSPAIGLNSNSVAQPSANPTASTSYTVTVTGVNGCTASDDVWVNVDTTPPVADAGTDKNLDCITSSATIGTVAITGNTYSWSPAIGISSVTLAQPLANPIDTTTYSLTVTGANGCISTDDVVVYVNILPPFADAGTPKQLCFGDSVVIGTPEIPGNTYLWTPAIGLSSATVAQPIAGPGTTTIYTVTVTGANGCTSADAVTAVIDSCLIAISGNVFHDTNGLVNLNVDGPGISSPNGVQLYVNLIHANNHIIASVPIQSDGTFLFPNVPTNQPYSIILDTIQGITGNLAPVPNLPGTWVNTGEDCCDLIGDDGNPNGIISFSVGTTSKTNINFGIKDPAATGTVPVILKNFYVMEYKCSGLLSWTTLQEENSLHVEIYRRDQGQSSFHKIATVQSAGTSHEPKVYNYLDMNVSQDGEYEYQLKFVDIDKQFTTSNIRTLKLDCLLKHSGFNIFPNPATDMLNVVYTTEEDDIMLELDCLDITGRKIFSQSQKVYGGGTLITLDISFLASGTYLLHYKDIDGLVYGSVKFIKH